MRKPIKTIKNPSQARKVRRKLSIRKKVQGTAEKPRICAIKSNKHLQVQIVDDTSGKTLFSFQSFGKNKIEGSGKTKDGAKILASKIAEALLSKNISQAVFDRNGARYTGVISVLADAMREKGLKI